MKAQEAHAGVRLGERAELAESDGRLAQTLASRPGPMSNDEIQALAKLLACGGSQPASLRLAWLCLLVSYKTPVPRGLYLSEDAAHMSPVQGWPV